MVDPKYVKPICCENCGFPFDFAAAEYVPQAACPACGFRMTIAHGPFSTESNSGEPQRELFQIGVTQEDLQRCREENCPRMKRETMSQGSPKNVCGKSACEKSACEMEGRCHTGTGTTVSVSENIGSAGDSKDRRHRGVLLFSTTMQVLLLLVAGFVLLKAYLEHEEVTKTPEPRRRSQMTTNAPQTTAPPFTVSQQESPTAAEAEKEAAAKKEAARLAAIAKAEAEKKEAERLAAIAKAEAEKKEAAEKEAKRLAAIAKAEAEKKEAARKEAERLAAAKAEAEKKVAAKKETEQPAAASAPTPPAVINDPFRREPSFVPPQESRSTAAETMLETAMAALADNPEKSLEDTLHAIRMFQEIPQPVPSISYWLLGQAYAALSWGKAFLVEWPTIEEMSVSPDSQWLLTRRQDGAVWVWDVVRDQEQRYGFPLNLETDRFVQLLFTPDRRWIVGGREDGTVHVWDMSKKNPAENSLRLGEKVPGLAGLAVSPDGRWLIAYGNPAAGPRISRNNRYLHSTPVEPIETVLVSLLPSVVKETEPLVVANERPSSKVAPIDTAIDSVASGRSTRQVTYLASESSRTGTDAAPSGKTASEKREKPAAAPSVLEESVVMLWDLNRLQNGTLPSALHLRGHKGDIHAVGFDKDSNLLAVGGADATTRVYNLRQKEPGTAAAILKGHRLDVTALTFAPGGRWIATGSRDNTIRLWSLGSSTSSSVVLEGHLGWVTSLGVDPKGNRLYSGSYDKTIRIWDVHPSQIDIAVQKPPHVLQNDQGVVRELRLTADGTRLISRGDDGSLRIRDLGGEIDNRHSVMFRNRMLPITQFTMTPDDRWLIFSYANRRNPAASGVRLWPLGFEQLVKIVGE